MDDIDPPRKHYDLKPRKFEQVNAPGIAPEKSTAHDVHAMLQQNRAVEQKAGINEIEIRPVTSRRKRDYWLVFIPSVGFLGLLAWLGRGNLYVLVSASAGIIIVSVGLTWIMWFVMDDY